MYVLYSVHTHILGPGKVPSTGLEPPIDVPSVGLLKHVVYYTLALQRISLLILESSYPGATGSLIKRSIGESPTTIACAARRPRSHSHSLTNLQKTRSTDKREAFLYVTHFLFASMGSGKDMELLSFSLVSFSRTMCLSSRRTHCVIKARCTSRPGSAIYKPCCPGATGLTKQH